MYQIFRCKMHVTNIRGVLYVQNNCPSNYHEK